MGARITGIHAIEEALKAAPRGSTLYLLRGDNRHKALEMSAMANGKTAVKKVEETELRKLAGTSDHRGAVLDLGTKSWNTPNPNTYNLHGPNGEQSAKTQGGRVAEMSVQDFCNSLAPDQGALVLALDQVTDPHNLGAILRSADQFSVGLILVPERRSATANQTVIRVSSGAAQYVKMATVPNLARELGVLKRHGFWIYGADMDGQASYQVQFSPRTVIVMGSEGSGLRPLVKAQCDHIISIPMTGHIDSLNVSVAAGILLYEFRRTT